MFPMAQKYVERVVLVTDEAIQEAQVELWKTLRLATEPGGAAAFAALLSRRYEPAGGESVGCWCAGGTRRRWISHDPGAREGCQRWSY